MLALTMAVFDSLVPNGTPVHSGGEMGEVARAHCDHVEKV
jgi:hypothetical protein